MKVNFKKDKSMTEGLLFSHAYKDLKTSEFIVEAKRSFYDKQMIQSYVKEIVEKPTMAYSDEEIEMLKGLL